MITDFEGKIIHLGFFTLDIIFWILFFITCFLAVFSGHKDYPPGYIPTELHKLKEFLGLIFVTTKKDKRNG